MTKAFPRSSDVNSESLISVARSVLANAYAPYSNIQVAAALLFEDGSIATGVNVENASLGLTICAERSAMVSAITQGKRRLKAVAITTNGEKPISPCGACRQVLSEFASPETAVILDTGNGKLPIIYSLSELLPAAFSPWHSS